MLYTKHIWMILFKKMKSYIYETMLCSSNNPKINQFGRAIPKRPQWEAPWEPYNLIFMKQSCVQVMTLKYTSVGVPSLKAPMGGPMGTL